MPHPLGEHDRHHHDEVRVVRRSREEHGGLHLRTVDNREEENDEVVGHGGEDGDGDTVVVQAKEREEEVSRENERGLEEQHEQHEEERAVLVEARDESARTWGRGVCVGVEPVAVHAFHLHPRLEDGI